MSLVLLLLGLLWGQQPTAPPAQPAVPSTLDYEFFKTKVQPIFLAKRPGHARCITCHETGNPRLATLEDGATTFSEAQSPRISRRGSAWSSLETRKRVGC